MPQILEPLPSNQSPARLTAKVLPPSNVTPSFELNAKNKSYKHQYANMYFARLRVLRQTVEQMAKRRWASGTGRPTLVPRVLEVVKAKLCYIVGTVYMDMPLKPNILEDIARDRSIPPPPPRTKIHSEEDGIMLEDESGRIRLVGDCVRQTSLVTGVIIAALGVETPSGDFEVEDICFAGMAPQPSADKNIAAEDAQMDVDQVNDASSSHPSDTWIAIISGLQVGASSPSDAQIQMLVEYLAGEEGGPDEQVSTSQISRLIIAGNSLAAMPDNEPTFAERRARRYGYDAASFSPHPTINLSAHLLDLCRVIPVHILPGATDPSGAILPQQPFPRAMFGQVASFTNFSCETNPTYLRLGCNAATASKDDPPVERTFLINSGQPLNDMCKYLPSSRNTKLSMIEATLRWRHMAPTAPDTLWCHPYFVADPFLIHETPHFYIVGGQKRFATRLIVEKDHANGGGGEKRCRVVLLPEFAESGLMVLVNMRSLDVKTIKFSLQGMTGSAE